MDIVPSKIAARVLAARRALAAEWVADLARIEADNAAVRVRALERSLRPEARRWMSPPLPAGVSPAPMSTAAMEAAAAKTAAAAAEAAAAEAAEAAAAAAAASAEFEFGAAPAGTDGNDSSGDDDEEYVSTPLRARNYASLKLLATKHALTRLLLGARDTAGRSPEYLFLQRFLRVQAAAAEGEPATTCGDALLASLAATAVVSAVTATSVAPPVQVAKGATVNRSGTGDGSPPTVHGFTIPTMVALVGGGIDGAEMLRVALDVRAAIAADWASALRAVPAEQHALQVSLLRRSLEVPSSDVCAPTNGEDHA